MDGDEANPLEDLIFDEVWEILEAIVQCLKTPKNRILREISKEEDKNKHKWGKLGFKILI